ncbi:MAG: 4Fe-4S dicluster domain-containing protein, partial [Actinomycetota bacterium]|nr:4Fe-4S dicluster domain-containing protein [Actinomycetota bacterium]
IYRKLRDLRDRYADLIRERYPDIPRRVSGYNLDELLPERGFHVARALVGSEGTCVNVLEATVRLVPSPPHRVTVVLGYRDVFDAADRVPEILTHRPLGLEGFNHLLVENMEFKGRLAHERRRLPPGRAWLLAEWGGDTLAEARERAEAAVAALDSGDQKLHGNIELLDSTADEKAVWTVRESAVGDSRAPGRLEAEGNWEDAAVHPDKLGAYLRDFQGLLDEHGLKCVYYGHFGQGCVHTRMDFDLKTAAGIRNLRSFMERAADLVVSYGGSLAGEYGEGQGRSELLPRMFGHELMEAFREFKAIWDPDGKMNPDRLIDAPPLDQNLRLGSDHRPPDLPTEFAYPRDRGSFATAVERCFGMAKCRRTLGEGYTMCPSYQVTGEERHSTRGRARLLLEMLKGEEIVDGWLSEEVREALDLCLSCKGCRADCPTQVDLATLKAEFLSHHYRRRLRPRAAYALGLFPWWTRLAARAPRAVNAVTRAPLLSGRLKQLGGISPERQLPRLAPESFRAWFERRGPRNRGGRRVVLWPDTFTNHLAPQVARAAVEVLEGAGLAVELPPQGLCCGRPLYDFGMLTLARRTLRQVLDAMGEQIHAGVPVVGLEPSCVAVFRDELVEMLPGDEDAHRLSTQTYTLSELLTREVPDFKPPALERRAVVQAHCHHRAIMGLDADRELLDALELEVERLEEGCCGMAGSFGYERDKHEISMRVGERAILPAVRDADRDTLVLADGFSCRSQIVDGTGRRALHLAEVLSMAMGENGAASGEPS